MSGVKEIFTKVRNMESVLLNVQQNVLTNMSRLESNIRLYEMENNSLLVQEIEKNRKVILDVENKLMNGYRNECSLITFEDYKNNNLDSRFKFFLNEESAKKMNEIERHKKKIEDLSVEIITTKNQINEDKVALQEKNRKLSILEKTISEHFPEMKRTYAALCGIYNTVNTNQKHKITDSNILNYNSNQITLIANMISSHKNLKNILLFNKNADLIRYHVKQYEKQGYDILKILEYVKSIQKEIAETRRDISLLNTRINRNEFELKEDEYINLLLKRDQIDYDFEAIKQKATNSFCASILPGIREDINNHIVAKFTKAHDQYNKNKDSIEQTGLVKARMENLLHILEQKINNVKTFLKENNNGFLISTLERHRNLMADPYLYRVNHHAALFKTNLANSEQGLKTTLGYIEKFERILNETNIFKLPELKNNATETPAVKPM